jgi:hypothetical protein
MCTCTSVVDAAADGWMPLSCTGSIFETRKRARVPYLLYALAAVLFAEIAFNGAPAVAAPSLQIMQSGRGALRMHGNRSTALLDLVETGNPAHAGYGTWLVEQPLAACVTAERHWNPQTIARVRGQKPHLLAACLHAAAFQLPQEGGS